MENQQQNNLSEIEKVGIDEAVRLAFKAVDRAKIPAEKKRQILYSLYTLRRVFDNAEPAYVRPLLEKHRLVKGGSFPEKLDLYPLVFEAVSLNAADTPLLAAWYVTFPYVMLLGAPHDADIYAALQDVLCTEEVFEAVLDSPYGVYVRDSIEELEMQADIPAQLTEWYAPYIAYKNERDDEGKSREEKRFLKWLGEGRFGEVYAGTEKLLDTFPDDDGILLCNVAARISLENVFEESARHALLKETLSLIESALERGSERKIYFYYYAALAHLGLQNKDAAEANFAACLEIKPDFEPAKAMMRIMNS